ncbi:MAG: ABC transporter permease [Deltaproteobacteria bacterium]|nr:ABC transporter permease [Deltaproteobacteria bacterium]
MRWEYRLGFRMLLGRKKQFLSPMSLIALCGIVFGVGATLTSLSVITGFQEAYEKAILGFNAHLILVTDGDIEDPSVLTPVFDEMRVTDEEALYWKKHAPLWRWLKHVGFFPDPKMEELQGKGIQGLSPFVYREGLALLSDEVAGVVLKGVDPSALDTVYPINYQLLPEATSGERVTSHESLVTGHWSLVTGRESRATSDEQRALTEALGRTDLKAPPVLVGKDLFTRFFPEGKTVAPARPAESRVIRLMVPKGDAEGKQTLKDYAQDFTVVGFFESGLYEFDSQFILTGLSSMQKLFQLDKKVSGVEMVLDDPHKARDMARALEAILPIPADIISWDQLNEDLFSAMRMEKTLFLVVMLLIVLVASFNVMGVIFMMILNRRGDLAVLKAVGAQGSRLRRAFSAQGAVMGLSGSVAGSFLSALCLWSLDRFGWFALDPQIYFISRLPVAWAPSLWIGLVASSVMICYGSAFVAAKVALKAGGLSQTFR